jgi:signal transduction histidine kinase
MSNLLDPAGNDLQNTERITFEVYLNGEYEKYLKINLFKIILPNNRNFVGQLTSDISENKIYDIELEKYRTQLEQMVEVKTKELASTKEKTEDLDRLKSEFFANISREIHTSINAITGYANNLEREDISLRQRKEFIKNIKNNTMQLGQFINDLTDEKQ